MTNNQVPVVNLAPGEERRKCPYNKNHDAGISSIGIHISKCYKKYVKTMIANWTPEEAFVVGTCRFNKRHSRIPIKELEYHEKYTCEDRNRKVDENEDGWKDFIPKKPNDQLNMILEQDENWDNDEEFHFNVKDKLQTEFIFRQPPGMTKSEKADFKEAQRKRILVLKRPQGLVLPDQEVKEEFGGRISRSRRDSVTSQAGSVYYDAHDNDDGPGDDLFYDLTNEDDLFEDALEELSN